MGINKYIWEYYKKVDNVRNKGKSYSVDYFYKGDCFDPNQIDSAPEFSNIAKAFLGDNKIRYSFKLASDSDIEKKKEDVLNGFTDFRNYIGDKDTMPPNDSQLESIASALLNDVTIVTGPPGTGKTATIRELLVHICQVAVKDNTTPRIAVVSRNQKAVENVVSAMVDLQERELNLGSGNKHIICGRFADIGNKEKRTTFCESYASFGNIYGIQDSEYDKRKKNLDDQKTKGFFWKDMDNFRIVFSTINSLRKCFRSYDEKKALIFDQQYDYVIIDECSQVSSYLGLIMAASARHLVVLGDDSQLYPIHKKVVFGWGNIPRDYRDEDKNSFMKALETCFTHGGAYAKHILLNEHFRCHPKIIGFCIKEVYGGDKNIIVNSNATNAKTEPMPIRVRWYKGGYREKLEKKEKRERKPESVRKKSNFNKMQERIFMEEEWNHVLDLVQADKSVCIISPYKKPLKQLKKRLEENIADRGFDIEIDMDQGDSSAKNGSRVLPELTIHKSQGKEYDYICILSVDDYWDGRKELWSQEMELVNVSVSRAKEELCVIISYNHLKNRYLKEVGINQKFKKGKNMFLQKLMNYVYDQIEALKETQTPLGKGYGFIETEIKSVFGDRLKYDKKKKKRKGGLSKENKFRIKKPEERPSSLEMCVLEALWQDDFFREANYEIYREVAVQELVQQPSITPGSGQEMVYQMGRYDIVICKGCDVLMIIEIDGAFHRSDDATEIIERDKLKNEIAKLQFEEAKKSSGGNKETPYEREEDGIKVITPRFIRIPTDGTTGTKDRDEIDVIKKLIEDASPWPMLTVKDTTKLIKWETDRDNFIK